MTRGQGTWRTRKYEYSTRDTTTPEIGTQGTRFIYILKNYIYIKKIHKDLHFLKTRSIYNVHQS